MPPAVYPVLVVAEEAEAPGLLIEDLSDEEWVVIDAFEDPMYELYSVQTTIAQTAWVYAGINPPPIQGSWDKGGFVQAHLPAYAARCAAWAERFRASTSRTE